MGSATRVALGEAKARLASLGSKVDLATGEELFAAGRIIGDSSHLLGALSDPGVDGPIKAALVKQLFGPGYGPNTVDLLSDIASSRWSSHSDLLAGIEEIGIRAIALSAPAEAAIDAERVKANAQVAIEADRQAALVSLRSEVGSLAIDLASNVIGESLTDDQKATALVDRFLADLEASDTSGKK